MPTRRACSTTWIASACRRSRRPIASMSSPREAIELGPRPPGGDPRHDLADALLGERPREVGRVDPVRDLARRARGVDVLGGGLADEGLARRVVDSAIEERREEVLADVARPERPVTVERDRAAGLALPGLVDREDDLVHGDRTHRRDRIRGFAFPCIEANRRRIADALPRRRCARHVASHRLPASLRRPRMLKRSRAHGNELARSSARGPRPKRAETPGGPAHRARRPNVRHEGPSKRGGRFHRSADDRLHRPLEGHRHPIPRRKHPAIPRSDAPAAREPRVRDANPELVGT